MHLGLALHLGLKLLALHLGRGIWVNHRLRRDIWSLSIVLTLAST